MKEFEEWSRGKYQGIGVIHFVGYPPANQFFTHKNALSSEWTASIKLNVNYANLAGVPGAQSETRSSNLCRHCNREKEIPSHVLGACPHNENLITARHHRVKKTLIQLLRQKDVTCFEEVFCYDESGCRRFCDIVAFPKK
uniref:Reverse transcriptase n=1 Tax=Cacopsylla melanoneura TaxID=428564 RepID=A0A8D9EYR4_9HEMI